MSNGYQLEIKVLFSAKKSDSAEIIIRKNIVSVKVIFIVVVQDVVDCMRTVNITS